MTVLPKRPKRIRQLLAFSDCIDALCVISLDPRISEWLGDNDPKALIQVRKAIDKAMDPEIDPVKRIRKSI